MADTKTWPTKTMKGGGSGRRRAPRGPRWLRSRPNPIYGLPVHQFYAMLIYRLLIGGMVTAVFVVGMLTDK